MDNIKTISHLQLNRIPTTLPYSNKIDGKKEIVFLFSNKTSDLLNIYNNNFIKRQMKYTTYYIENTYKDIIYRKRFFIKKYGERKELYKNLKQTLPGLRTLLRVELVSKVNTFVDLLWYNEIFFERLSTVPIQKRCDEFVKYYTKIFNNKHYDEYGKCILINMDQWGFTKIKALDDIPTIIYMMLKKKLSLIQSMGDLDFIFYTNNLCFRMNCSKVDKNSHTMFIRLIKRLNPSYDIVDDEAEYDKLLSIQDTKIQSINNIISNNTNNFIGKPLPLDPNTSIKSKSNIDNLNIEDEDDERIKVANILSDIDVEKDVDENDDTDTVEDKIIQKVNNDNYTLNRINNIMNKVEDVRSAANKKRDEKIKEEHKTVMVGDTTLQELLYTGHAQSEPIKDIDVSASVKTPNKNVTSVRYNQIAKTYNEKLYVKDIVGAFDSLSKKEIPLYIRNIDVQDTSDEMDYKETWTVNFEDTNRVRHTIKVDIPKFIDDQYTYLGGNYKFILNQMYPKPVIKIAPHEVQIVTSYNKITLRLQGTRVSSEIEKLVKMFSESVDELDIKLGNSALQNDSYSVDLEYFELSKHYATIKVKNSKDPKYKDAIFIFNQKEIDDKIKDDKDIVIGENEECVGFYANKKPIIINKSDLFINWFCDNVLSEEMVNKLNSIKVGSRYMYTIAILMKKKVPLIIVLGFFEGLTTVLKKAKVEYRFESKKPSPNLYYDSFRFKDGWLVYKKTPDLAFLMNALHNIDTESHNYEDFDDRSVYVDLIENIYGERNRALAYLAYYNCMIDNICEGELRRLNLPTDLVSLMLYGNSLLKDNDYLKAQDMHNYRIRNHEAIAAILYKVVSTAYGKYYLSASNKRPTKVSVPRDAVIKKFVSTKTTEGVDMLNPFFVLDRMRAVTPMGVYGMNLDEFYTMPKRTYDDSMLGVIAMVTPPDGSCGKIRYLTLNPNITDARGYVKITDKDKLDSLTDANCFCAAEMSTVGSVRYDDSMRVGHMIKQSGHLMPTDDMSPVLVSNGSEQVVQYQLPSQYAIIAEDDGEVIEVDDKNHYIFVKYKNGKVRAIDLNVRIDKNGGGGFSLSNKLQCNLKLHQKVKKDDILATDSKFFKNDLFGNRLCIGTLCKVAIYSSYATFEDSTLVTQSAAEKMATYVTKEESIILGKNSNIEKIAKIGDTVEVNEDLIVYEPSFDESELNMFLSNIGDDLKESIKMSGKNRLKSDYTGVITDIKIYAGCELDEMSPSLRKICKEYYDDIKSKRDALDKYDKSNLVKCGVLFNKTVGKYNADDKFGKIKGFEVDDGVLILFYIEYKDIIGVGDKITNYAGIKSTVGEIIPVGQEPFSTFRPDEKIEVFLPPSSVLKRMAISAPTIGFENKVLVELKRKLADMYYGRPYPSPISEYDKRK